jgi:hypothetical protein
MNSRGFASIAGAFVVFATTWFLQTASGFRDDYDGVALVVAAGVAAVALIGFYIMKPRARGIALLACGTALNVCSAVIATYSLITGPPATVINRRPDNDVSGLLLFITMAVVSVLAIIGTLRGWRGAVVLKTVSMIWTGFWVLVILCCGVLHITA